MSARSTLQYVQDSLSHRREALKIRRRPCSSTDGVVDLVAGKAVGKFLQEMSVISAAIYSEDWV